MKKLENYISNLKVLSRAPSENLENEFIKGGIIDKFCIQLELGWKLLKVLLSYEGRSEAKTGSPREIIKAAYSVYDFIDGELWLEMLKSRNDTTHIYDSHTADALVGKIISDYIPEFERVRDCILLKYGNYRTE